MSLKDAAGTIIIVLAIVTLAFQSRAEFSQTTRQIGDLRERITRVETVIYERLPRPSLLSSLPTAVQAGASEDEHAKE